MQPGTQLNTSLLNELELSIPEVDMNFRCMSTPIKYEGDLPKIQVTHAENHSTIHYEEVSVIISINMEIRSCIVFKIDFPSLNICNVLINKTCLKKKTYMGNVCIVCWKVTFSMYALFAEWLHGQCICCWKKIPYMVNVCIACRKVTWSMHALFDEKVTWSVYVLFEEESLHMYALLEEESLHGQCMCCLTEGYVVNVCIV